jgi:hypothetical protein
LLLEAQRLLERIAARRAATSPFISNSELAMLAILTALR